MNDSATVYHHGYCTNVHAGISIDAAKANLERYACDVRQRLVPQGRLPVGLWLAEQAAHQLLREGRLADFRAWLEEKGLVPYTLNGFPQQDFHQPVVKHAVYEPTWLCQSRAEYTKMLIDVLAWLLPQGSVGTISTLPLGWPHAPWHADDLRTAAEHLLEVAQYAKRMEEETGRHIVVAIEPEPGCVLNTASEVVEFFTHYLFSGRQEAVARRHLSVCHDICHSGVMFEPQAEALEQYRRAGIRLGKVQVSSAIHVPWDRCQDDPGAAADIRTQLARIGEPKYLHQTTAAAPHGRLQRLIEDLPHALSRWLADDAIPRHPWRIHFHIPIYVDCFGSLQTTQDDIGEATTYLEQYRQETVDGMPWFTGHYEVETYAWTVLPPELATDNLAAGIAQELEYFSIVRERIKMART
ncbi:MAG: xylose isomerase [Pirellulaceae bacterium]|nr:MAG: xylose isomerase [Pirellulaceae bacterium]